jgi:hypothetical protein
MLMRRCRNACGDIFCFHDALTSERVGSMIANRVTNLGQQPHWSLLGAVMLSMSPAHDRLIYVLARYQGRIQKNGVLGNSEIRMHWHAIWNSDFSNYFLS